MRAAALLAMLLLAPAAIADGDAPVSERRTKRGPVEAIVRIAPAAPRIGDPLTFEIEVVAEPGVELLMPEFGEALDRFKIVDFAPSEHIDDAGRTRALQRYTLDTHRSGVQSLPPILIEFVDRRPGQDPAPEGEDAYELLTERFEFEVSSQLPEGAALELEPALGALAPLAPPSPPLWPWALAALAIAAAAAPFAYRAWRARRSRARRRSAYEISRADLDDLLYGRRPSDAAQMDAFFVELSRLVRRYLEDRFQIHSPELTTEEFLVVMADSPDLSRDHQQLLRSVLGRADLVKFAHVLPDASGVEESVQTARRFLEETREDAPLIEVPNVTASTTRVSATTSRNVHADTPRDV